VSPSKVANALEWNCSPGSSLLAMHVNSRGSLELLVASHPSYNEPTQSLPSIPLRTEILQDDETEQQQKNHSGPFQECSDSRQQRSPPKRYRRLSPGVAQEFRQILEDWQVRGVVVAWPVQPEGWCGAACGRALFALDGLHSHGVFCSPSSIPLCLWDQIHHDMPYEDEWGRSEQYSTTCNRTVHYASKEQYDLSPGNFTVSSVWHDFCRTHWPEYYCHGRLATRGEVGHHPGAVRPSSRHSVNLVAKPPAGRPSVISPPRNKSWLLPLKPNLAGKPPNLRSD
jgi:hypothetical protein